MVVCIGGSILQLQYMYYLFDSGGGAATAAADHDPSGLATTTTTSSTNHHKLPPRLLEAEALHQAYHAFDAIPELILPPPPPLIKDPPPVLYLITPTHKRVTQMVDLTRVSQTLQLAKLKYGITFYWIMVEDSKSCTQRIRQLLWDSDITFAHLNINTHKTVAGHKGLDQRNKALNLIRTHLRNQRSGIVYFLDDDNAYDVRVFPELLSTQFVSVGAVGLPSPSNYERCHVNQTTGKVDRLLSGWSVQERRPFGIDMAGFAFSTSLLGDPDQLFSRDSEKGFLEHDFLKRLVDGQLHRLEPLGGNCTRVLVWHVRTSVGMPNRLYKTPELKGTGNGTLLMQLV
jgi:galactosylgalactosylxylosylprotein 3-beta-glucuronosyltransferase 3